MPFQVRLPAGGVRVGLPAFMAPLVAAAGGRDVPGGGRAAAACSRGPVQGSRHRRPYRPYRRRRQHRWPVAAVRRAGAGRIDGSALLPGRRRCAIAAATGRNPDRSGGPAMRVTTTLRPVHPVRRRARAQSAPTRGAVFGPVGSRDCPAASQTQRYCALNSGRGGGRRSARCRAPRWAPARTAGTTPTGPGTARDSLPRPDRTPAARAPLLVQDVNLGLCHASALPVPSCTWSAVHKTPSGLAASEAAVPVRLLAGCGRRGNGLARLELRDRPWNALRAQIQP